MKSAKIFIAFTFLLAFALSLSAQNYSYPNELKGFELFKDGKWKSLVPFVSTKEDVKKVFGSDCKKGCNYDKDWKVTVEYVSQYWQSPTFAPCISEELLGKVERIYFFPKKSVSMKDVIFPDTFQNRTFEVDHKISPKTAYFDSDGLVYMLLANNFDEYWQKQGQTSSKYKSNDLLFIYYRISENEAGKIKDKIKCFDFVEDAIYSIL
jgi:hypothetical protein